MSKLLRPSPEEVYLYNRLEETKDERDKLQAKLDHRFIEAAEELGAKVSDLRRKQGRVLIRGLHKELGPLLDELDAAYNRWIKGEPGGRL